MNKTLFSTGKNDWETPQELFDLLGRDYRFTLDACATKTNAKCARFFSPEEDALTQDWGGETVWCNPPYSAKQQDAFVKKCFEESRKPGTTVVALLPARTDTNRFHRYIYGRAEIRFVWGRITFVGAENPAPFPSMIVTWRYKEATDT